MIKLDFTITDGKYSFSDALHLDDDPGLSDAELGAMKQSRFDNWIAIITALPPEEETPPPDTEG